MKKSGQFTVMIDGTTEKCQNDANVATPNKIKAQGYSQIVKNPYFILLNNILFEIFTTMNITTTVLQSRDLNLVSAMRTIQECQKDREHFRTIYNSERIQKDLQTMNSLYGSKDRPLRGKRQTSLPHFLSESVIDEHLPS